MAEISSTEREENKTMTIVKKHSVFPLDKSEEDFYKFFKQAEALMWTASELNFSQDKEDRKKLSPEKDRLLMITLGFFMVGDGIVNENIFMRFISESTSSVERMYYTFQAAIESVHQESYSMMVYTMYDEKEIEYIQQTVCESQYMREKINFMEKWKTSDRSKPERHMAYACGEGLFFGTPFLFIFWFRGDKSKVVNKVNFDNLIHTNELIIRDESMHKDFQCLSVRRYRFDKNGNDLTSDETLLEIVKDAVEIESNVVEWTIGEGIEDLRKNDVITYVKVLADGILMSAGLKPYYNAKNPFPWMDDISMPQINNFYEIKGGRYTRFSVSDALNWRKRSGLFGEKSTERYSPEDIDF